ncbi:MAG: CCA tRNA nucleotidyltransferase [Candidatus Micrarchaeota archaeon]
MEIERIFAKIASEVSPSPVELAVEKKFAAKVIANLEKFLPKNAKVTFVGSAARDTGLRGDRDIDLFVAFPREMDEDKIVKLTFNAAKKAVKTKWVTHYAEHPYLQTIAGDFQVEVIPCFQVEPHTGIKSAVDRSPLHMEYLQKKLTQRQRRDVRVMKKLLKVNGVYGAEVTIGGFSGLVCEQLMLKYGDLESLLREATEWRPPVIVDYEGSWNSETKQGKTALLQKFKDTGLILIDVIDKNRNAAAAITNESLAKFILLSRAFVKKPSLEFFKEKKVKINVSKINAMLKKRGTVFITIEVKKPDFVDDIIFPQFKRSEKNIARELQRVGFNVIGSCDLYEKGQLLFEVQNNMLPAVKQIIGPLAWDTANVAKFLKGKKPLRGPYIENGKMCVDMKQSKRGVIEMIKVILHRSETGIASHYQTAMKKAKVQIVKKVDKQNATILHNYLFAEIGLKL